MSIVLPFVPLTRHKELGLVPEDVTVKEFRLLQYEYCAWELAQAWLDGQVVFTYVTFPELDDEEIPLKALCKAQYAEQIAEAGLIMCEGRRIQRSEERFMSKRERELGGDVEFGYEVAPTGLTETFSAHSAHVFGWMSIHKAAPALLVRRNDEDAEDLISDWLEYWASTLDVRKPWPDQKKHAGLIVPEAFQRMRETLPKRRKSRRPVARFIGLSA